MQVMIDNSVYLYKRGVYGLFVIRNGVKNCVYVGRRDQIKKRIETHKTKIEKGRHLKSLLDAFIDDEAIIFATVLEEVPYCFDNYSKDAQRLASAENYWIDKFQSMNQCLEQIPEGKRPSLKEWEKMKKLNLSNELL